MTKVTRSITRAGACIIAAGLMSGCGDPAGLDSIEDLAVRDMALVAADATLEVVNTWGQPYGFGGTPQAVGAMGGPGSGFGSPGGRHGLGADGSGTRTRTFYDEGGTVQAEYDELTTERIEVETIIDGEVSRDNWTATVYRERAMTITGLAGEETHRTYNGSGSSETSGSRHTDDGDRTYDMSGTFTYDDVVVPIPGSDPRYPISGTITRSMSSTRTNADGVVETREMEMTITFDGDETAIAIVNGEEYEIDLSTREGRRPWRRDRG